MKWLFTFFINPCFFTCLLCSAQSGSVMDGPNAVGFRSQTITDYRRTILPEKNIEGSDVGSDRFHQMQLGIWYPAANQKGKKMKFKDYLVFDEPFDFQKSLITNIKLGLGKDLPPEDYAKILETPMSVVKDAAVAKGRFPVIICSQQSGPRQLSTLSEFLASNGFVVISTSLNIRQFRDMMPAMNTPAHSVVINDRINDIELLYEFISRLDYADINNTGLIGVNSEGIPALLFQMKNMRAKAVVSIDGWENSKPPNSIVEGSPYFNITRFRVPYLLWLSDRDYIQKLPPADFHLFDSLSFSERYTMTGRKMNHSFIMGNLAMIQDVLPEQKESVSQVFRALLDFFDGHLRSNNQSLQRLSNSLFAKSDTSVFVNVRTRPADPAGPVLVELEQLIMSGELDRAKQLFRTAHEKHSELYPRYLLNRFATYFNWQESPGKVLAVRKMICDLFPNSMKAVESLGDAFVVQGDKEKALECYRKAQKLSTVDTELDQDSREALRKQIEEKEKRILN